VSNLSIDELRSHKKTLEENITESVLRLVSNFENVTDVKVKSVVMTSWDGKLRPASIDLKLDV